MIQELLEAILTDAGHVVVLVPNGIAAIEALQARDFDVVLMDVQMPGLDGISATRWIRAMSGQVRNIPIIALTAYAMADDAEQCRTAGANAYLSKPIDRNRLLHLIAKWSESGHSRSVPSHDTLMDVGALDRLEKRFGKARATEFAGQFQQQVRKTLDTIAGTTDRHRIEQEMHDLISSAGVVGCNELVTCSRLLMEAARREAGELGPLVARLAEAAGRALTAMQARYSILESTRAEARSEMSADDGRPPIA